MSGLNKEFNEWWNSDELVEDNPFGSDTAMFWAWEGWHAGVKAEREKVAKWMMQRSYATGHGETIEDLLAELDWQIRESEREACAKVCDDKVAAEYATGKVDHNEMGWTQACAIAIRARGQG